MSDTSSDEERITSEELVSHLSTLITNISEGKYRGYVLQDIFDATQEYITGIPQTLDPNAIAYLFRGWWITNQMESLVSVQSITNCPYCLQIIPTESKEENNDNS